MDTDTAWEQWGALDPYYGVLTAPRFRTTALDDDSREEFFDSGRRHVRHTLEALAQRVVVGFVPQRVLDFGCGVGRLVIPFAAVANEVVGMDVSPSMLAEAGRNCAARGIGNVALVLSDDSLTHAQGSFDLVHSTIVLQHIEITRGRALFASLVDKIAPGGCGALHVTFGWDVHAANFGQPPRPPAPPSPPVPTWGSRIRARLRHLFESTGLRRPHVVIVEPAVESRDPEMQMNYYNVSELMFILQRAGVARVYAEFTNHGGALGVALYFQKNPT